MSRRKDKLSARLHALGYTWNGQKTPSGSQTSGLKTYHVFAGDVCVAKPTTLAELDTWLRLREQTARDRRDVVYAGRVGKTTVVVALDPAEGIVAQQSVYPPSRSVRLVGVSEGTIIDMGFRRLR